MDKQLNLAHKKTRYWKRCPK